ncbi:MAG: class II aldolase/adducin family protein [Bacteroidales bacterium]
MKKINEGYIKFNLQWEKKSVDFPGTIISELNIFRTKLFDFGLIGMYPNGIGFGNISSRIANTDQFIISGSATGQLRTLTKEHFSLVTGFEIEKNTVICQGQIAASSESMSHAALYKSNQNINAVVHVHHKKLWEKYLNNLPATPKNAEYGTPKMANEIKKLAHVSEGIIIMGGHEEGIVSFGITLEEATNKIIKLYDTL